MKISYKMSNVTTHIEPLGKNNFDTWKLQIEALLIKNDTWCYVNGEKIKPELKPDDEESKKCVNIWVREDKKAKSDLILSISPPELKQVKNCETSHDLWMKLHEIYASKGPARKATLLKKLITHKMADGIDIKVNLDEFFDAVDKLIDMGISINDDLLTIILLYSLPENFENFRCAIESRDELPKPEVLRIKIIEEFEARKSRDGVNIQNAMYVEKPYGQGDRKFKEKNSRPSVSKNQFKFKFKCHKCRKVGHKASECREKQKNESSKLCKEKQEYKEEIAMSQLKHKKKKNYDWCLDSGCTSHMSPYRENFYHLTNVKKTLNLANGDTAVIQGIGEVKLNAFDGENSRRLSLQKVMFVPELYTNLMSIAKITDKGFEVKFNKDNAFITDQDDNLICIADRHDDLYYIRKSDEVANLLTKPKENNFKWHQKMGHINFDYLVNMSQNKEVIGMKIGKENTDKICEVCVKAKQTQTPFKKSDSERASDLLEIVHTDVCGPMRTTSFSGAKYFVTFIDDKSRWCKVYFIKKKNEVLNVFKQYKNIVENYCGKRIKYLQSDNGLEYCNKEFDELLKENGIQRRLTVPYTPQQNGLAERKNRTLIETARSLMLQSGVPSKFWAEAINTANYIRNRCISKSLNGTSPYKIWTGRVPNVRYFQIFGTKAFILNKEQNKDKFSSRSKECMFIGYSEESKAYRLWDGNEKKVLVSRDVVFTEEFPFISKFEDCFEYCSNEDNKMKSESPEKENLEVIVHDSKSTKLPQDEIVIKQTSLDTITPTLTSTSTITRGKGRPKLLRCGQRGRPRKLYQHKKGNKNKSHGTDQVLESESTEETEDELANFAMGPTSLCLSDVLNGDEVEEWKSAISQEFLALVKNETFDIVDLPENVNLIKGKFVLTEKFDALKNIQKKKARLVARGFSQRKGVDYFETFSPVIRSTSIRVLMALAVKNEMVVHQMDVVTAYLNGELDEKIYMEIPEMFKENMNEIVKKENLDVKIKNTAKCWLKNLDKDTRKVCLLKKSLYGLKQSGRQWYFKLDKELETLGFQRTNADPCIYIQKINLDTVIIAVYVDDILLISNNEDHIKSMKYELNKKFEMKDLGRINNCLGIEFKQSEDRKTITMCQEKYSREILKRFGMVECKPVTSPLDANVKLQKCESVEKSVYPYQSLIGSLMYLATSTRPDLSYPVSMLSQFNNCYSQVHWSAAKRVLRYLQKTIDHGIVFRKIDDNLVGYADSDWGNSIDDRRSYTGFVFTLSGACISWESRKQRTVALSSTEAEYMALSDASKEVLHLKKLLFDLHESVTTVTVFNDNQGARQLARNPVFHNRTKHIDVRYHFLREVVQNGEIDIRYMPTNRMPADFLTKALPGPKHNYCKSFLKIDTAKLNLL